MAAGNAKSQASGASPGPQNGGQGAPQGLEPLSFYGLLQLAEDASLEELRQAFRRQSKRLHPDTTSLPAAVAQDSFRQLRQAYVTLLDPERRRAYDASLAAARARAGQGLRSAPGAPGSSPAGAGPGWAGGAGGPGIRPSQNGSPASLGGPAARTNPAGAVRSPGTSPGAANRQGNGDQANANQGHGAQGNGAQGYGTQGYGTQGNGTPGNRSQGNGSQGSGDQGAKGLDASGLGVGDGLPKPDSVRRTLSGGEWFALLLLGVALVFCLVLGVGLAWLRGTELVREPSWWPDQQALEPSQPDPFPPGLSQSALPLLTPPLLTPPPRVDPALQASALPRPGLP